MANDIQIRPELIKAGYTDADIGYDEGRKMTTLKGQDFLGANDYINVAGSTFTDRQKYDNALKKYNQGQQLATVQNQAFNTTPTVNPYDTQIDELFKTFQNQVNNPTQVNPYGTPQYAAAQAQMARQSDRGIRAAQESMGSAGFGRSTALGESAQRVQNDADNYLQTQMLPQIVQQLQAQEAQKTQSMYQLLNSLMGQQGVHDTRANSKQTNALDQLDFLTGRQDRSQDIERADDRFSLEDERYNEEIEYNRGRDAIADENYKLEYDEDVRRYGLEFALKKAEANNMMENRNAGTANSAANTTIDNLMEVFKTTGIAPAGLESVGINKGDTLPEGSTIGSAETTASAKVDPKDSISVYNDLFDDLEDFDSVEAKAIELGLTPKQAARQLLELNKPYMTDSDYKKSNDYINDNF